MSHAPTLGLALGAGGARGLAHIVVLEALEEWGIAPAIIAGTSMGAVIGAASAAGIDAPAMRRHALGMLGSRREAMARVLQARVGRFAELFGGQLSNPVLLDGARVLDLFWPAAVPDRFDQLRLPFIAVATDYAGRCEALFDAGALAPAVAASMAIPGLLRPVQADGRVLVDGGIVNPLPFRTLAGRADIVLAVDVMGGPVAESAAPPTSFAAMFGAAQIMMIALTREMLAAHPPDILIRPPVETFRALDFFKAADILKAASPVKDAVKRALDAAFAAFDYAR